MKKREELAQPDSCLNKAGDDEEIFVILGRDPAAPATVYAWIQERIRLGLNKAGDAKITSAMEWFNRVGAE